MLKESIIQPWFQGVKIDLPEHWKVIYYEGIHGHHILFKKDDIKIFENTSLDEIRGLSKKEYDTIEEIAMKLLCAPSYRDMVEQIDSLNLRLRYDLYRLYLKWLGSMKEKIRGAAN